MLSIQPTFPIFTDIDGQPLENGYIFIGQANQNPITNPISVFFNPGLTVLAGQPIRTIGGYPANAGTPGRLYVNSDYSIQVQNKNGSVVYSSPTATERYSNVVISGVNAENVIYDPPFTNSVSTNVEAKLAQTVSVKDFGVNGTGTNEKPVLENALKYAAINLKRLDLNGLNIAFDGDLTIYGFNDIPGSPNAQVEYMFNGSLYSLTGGKIIFSQISGARYEKINFVSRVEDRGMRESKWVDCNFVVGYTATASLRDILWNHWDTCQFGFGSVSAGVTSPSIWINVPGVPNNPFNSNQFTNCKIKGGDGIICLDTANSTGNVRGNNFFSCDMSAVGSNQTLMRHGSTFQGNSFIGGFHEGGGRIVMNANGTAFGNNFWGSKLDNSYIDSPESFNQFQASGSPRLSFGWTSTNGSNVFFSGYPRLTDGGSLLGWSSNCTMSNDAAAPAGFTGTNALKLVAGGNGSRSISANIPLSIHKNAGFSVAMRVYVPSTYDGGPSNFSPELRISDTFYQITQRNEWVTITSGNNLTTTTVILFVQRLFANAANTIYVDWMTCGVGGTASLYDASLTDHHNSDLQHYGDFELTESTWQQSRLQLGGYYLWVDSTGDLRIKNGAPTSDTDGTIVGNQS